MEHTFVMPELGSQRQEDPLNSLASETELSMIEYHFSPTLALCIIGVKGPSRSLVAVGRQKGGCLIFVASGS